MRTGFDQTVGMCSVTIAFRWFIRSYLISSYLISSHPILTQPIFHHISSHLISSRLILSQLVSSYLISSQLIPSHLFSDSLIIHVFKNQSNMDKFVTCMTFDTEGKPDENQTRFGYRIQTTRCFHLISHWISRFTHQNKRN